MNQVEVLADLKENRLKIGKRNGFFWGLVGSLLVHVLLLVGAEKLPPAPPPTPIKTSQIEIEIKDHDEVVFKPQQEVVREAPVPDAMKTKESDDPLAFFSAENQKVKKQLRALINGMTANRAARAPKEIDRPRREKKIAHADLFKTTKDSLVRAPNPERENQDELPINSLRLPMGVSTVGETLPDELEVGEFTALNTDRYLYYTFFARVEELIRYGWEDAVRATTYRTPKGVFQASLHSNWVTQVDILLKPSGEFHKALLLKESGISGFDWAAMDSFANAKLFPHPPHEMVESDGFIHLRYTFTVRINPKALAKQN